MVASVTTRQRAGFDLDQDSGLRACGALTRNNGRTQTSRVAGEDEADPAKGTLAHVSPLAKNLFGKKVSETASVGGGEVEILAIK